jgi:hypothetical protein
VWQTEKFPDPARSLTSVFQREGCHSTSLANPGQWRYSVYLNEMLEGKVNKSKVFLSAPKKYAGEEEA